MKRTPGYWALRGWQVSNQRHVFASGGAATPREAALWLIRKVNQVADETEQALIELGFLTERECELALAEKEPINDDKTEEK